MGRLRAFPESSFFKLLFNSKESLCQSGPSWVGLPSAPTIKSVFAQLFSNRSYIINSKKTGTWGVLVMDCNYPYLNYTIKHKQVCEYINCSMKISKFLSDEISFLNIMTYLLISSYPH